MVSPAGSRPENRRTPVHPRLQKLLDLPRPHPPRTPQRETPVRCGTSTGARAARRRWASATSVVGGRRCRPFLSGRRASCGADAVGVGGDLREPESRSAALSVVQELDAREIGHLLKSSSDSPVSND